MKDRYEAGVFVHVVISLCLVPSIGFGVDTRWGGLSMSYRMRENRARSMKRGYAACFVWCNRVNVQNTWETFIGLVTRSPPHITFPIWFALVHFRYPHVHPATAVAVIR